MQYYHMSAMGNVFYYRHYDAACDVMKQKPIVRVPCPLHSVKHQLHQLHVPKLIQRWMLAHIVRTSTWHLACYVALTRTIGCACLCAKQITATLPHM